MDTNQNIERDKALAALIEEPWYENDPEKEPWLNNWPKHLWPKNTNFSTWDGFGKLIAFLDNKWWDTEIAVTLYTLVEKHGPQNLPDSLANYLYTTTKALES